MGIDKRQLKDSGVIGGTYFNPTLIIDNKGLIISADTNNNNNNNNNNTSSTGLEAINEGNGIGWRLIGKTAANYGDIGLRAVDISNSSSASSTRGATGQDSFASGLNTTASGFQSHAEGASTTASTSSAHAEGSNTTASGAASHAEGNNTTASGAASHAGGHFNTAPSRAEMSIGLNSTNYTPNSTTSWNATDRVLNVGNGTNGANRHDAFTILKNGKTGIGYDNFETTTSEALLNVNGVVQTAGYTVATLPTGTVGMRTFVTNSSVVATGNFGTTVAGGGANTVPVFYDGTNWIIA